ncbi:hypothetical protein SO802_031666 [Lithocarpus litseifolius]|uniref:Uncharacterized protein n=1 Tax=Lithocarpus litseifolius TaxID=425828 RepID=A0AAW2BRR3_9ROSI
MAQVSISKALMLVLVIVVSLAATTVSAQDSQLAPAPAPMDAGAAFSLPISGALLRILRFWSDLAGEHGVVFVGVDSARAGEGSDQPS